MSMEELKERIRKQFADDVEIGVVNGILVVHLDNPNKAERKRRQVEIREGNFDTEDDCPLCQEMKKNPPQVVIYDQDSTLYLGSGNSGLVASGMPRKDKKGGPSAEEETS